MQSLRQEIPTLENGLVSSPPVIKTPTTSYRNAKSNTNIPDITSLSIRRGSGTSSSIPQLPTRSRSRTIPSSTEQRPEFIKSNSNSNFYEDTPLLSDSDSDSSDKCEIRRGSGPLLDSYGVPIQNKRYNTTPSNNSFASPPVLPQQQLSDLNQKIRVCVRKRPLNKKEIERCEKDIAPTAGVRSINVNEPK